MAQFDVHLLGSGLVVDCQSNLLNDISTRFNVPLIARNQAPPPARRFNPVFAIDGADRVMTTQFASAVNAASWDPPSLPSLTAQSKLSTRSTF